KHMGNNIVVLILVYIKFLSVLKFRLPFTIIHSSTGAISGLEFVPVRRTEYGALIQRQQILIFRRESLKFLRRHSVYLTHVFKTLMAVLHILAMVRGRT